MRWKICHLNHGRKHGEAYPCLEYYTPLRSVQVTNNILHSSFFLRKPHYSNKRINAPQRTKVPSEKVLLTANPFSHTYENLIKYSIFTPNTRIAFHRLLSFPA